MIGFIILTLYIIGYLIAWPRIYIYFYRGMMDSDFSTWDGADRAFCCLFTTYIASFWPLVVVGGLLIRLFHGSLKGLEKRA